MTTKPAVALFAMSILSAGLVDLFSPVAMQAESDSTVVKYEATELPAATQPACKDCDCKIEIAKYEPRLDELESKIAAVEVRLDKLEAQTLAVSKPEPSEPVEVPVVKAGSGFVPPVEPAVNPLAAVADSYTGQPWTYEGDIDSHLQEPHHGFTSGQLVGLTHAEKEKLHSHHHQSGQAVRSAAAGYSWTVPTVTSQPYRQNCPGGVCPAPRTYTVTKGLFGRTKLKRR